MLLISKVYFQCGTKGHYANKCPKGHLAFLALNQHKEGLAQDVLQHVQDMD